MFILWVLICLSPSLSLSLSISTYCFRFVFSFSFLSKFYVSNCFIYKSLSPTIPRKKVTVLQKVVEQMSVQATYHRNCARSWEEVQPAVSELEEALSDLVSQRQSAQELEKTKLLKVESQSNQLYEDEIKALPQETEKPEKGWVLFVFELVTNPPFVCVCVCVCTCCANVIQWEINVVSFVFTVASLSTHFVFLFF